MTEAIQSIEDLINQGRYMEARTATREALKANDHLRVKQLYALALSKAGLPEEALEYMNAVYSQFPDNPESAGILGSICKELFKKNQNSAYAIRSRDTYFKNFIATKNYYTGINAASMSAMAGQAGRAREIASEVIAILEGRAQDFWELATLGEAYLLTKNKVKSVEYYVQARKLAHNDWGKVNSVYQQLWLLNHFLPVSVEITKLFAPPTVVAFVGHMIDHPFRTEPRFPLSIEANIKSSIVNSIKTINAHIGYCSLACGGDILFAEALADYGGEVNIFIPFRESDFIETSIAFAGDGWVNRFEALRKRFPVSFVTHESYSGFDDLFAFQSKIIFGSAMLRSAAFHADPFLLTVLSEVDLKRKEGGTRDTIRLWPHTQRHININPDGYTPSIKSFESPGIVPPKPVQEIERPVLYLVHCDVREATALEKERVFKAINQKIDDPLFPFKVFELTTDDVLLAYEAEPLAMGLAAAVVEGIKGMNPIAVKVGVHAGPVLLTSSEGTGSKQASGEAVEIAKAVSHQALPGTISASNHFAALLALETKKFSLEYAGVFKQREDDLTIFRVKIRQPF